MKRNATNENLEQIKLNNQILTKKLPDLNFIKHLSQFEKQINRETPLMLVDMELFRQRGVELIQLAKLYDLSLVFINDKTVKDNKAEQPKQSCIKLCLESGIQLIKQDKIIRLKALSNYTAFYLKDTVTPIVVSKPLKFYANQFDSRQFIRPHRSHLVNTQFIKAYCNNKGHHLILKNGKRIIIARRKLKDILQILYDKN